MGEKGVAAAMRRDLGRWVVSSCYPALERDTDSQRRVEVLFRVLLGRMILQDDLALDGVHRAMVDVVRLLKCYLCLDST